MSRGYNILVTGVGSGLGHAVHATLGGVGLTRHMSLDDPAVRGAGPFDAIIHCAFNSAKSVSIQSGYGYVDDNLFLTERLLDVPHLKFIYVSSIDVYPAADRAVAEQDDVDVSVLTGLYGATKLISDMLVRERSPNHLILRPTSLMGPVMRPNSTTRVLTECDTRVFLSAESRFNFVLHEDVVGLIGKALEADIRGVYNVGSAGFVTFGEMASQLGLNIRFGDYLYKAKDIDTARAAELEPAFARPSWATLNRFIDSLGARFVGTGRLSYGDG